MLRLRATLTVSVLQVDHEISVNADDDASKVAREFAELQGLSDPVDLMELEKSIIQAVLAVTRAELTYYKDLAQSTPSDRQFQTTRSLKVSHIELIESSDRIQEMEEEEESKVEHDSRMEYQKNRGWVLKPEFRGDVEDEPGKGDSDTLLQTEREMYFEHIQTLSSPRRNNDPRTFTF